MSKGVAKRTAIGPKTFSIVRSLINEFFGHGPLF
jgi:hypothetical protein